MNGSIYHSSAYAAKTDEQWEEMKNDLIECYTGDIDAVNAL